MCYSAVPGTLLQRLQSPQKELLIMCENDKQLQKERFPNLIFFSIKEKKKSPSHNDLVSQAGQQNRVEGFAEEANFPICALSRAAYIHE